MCGVANRFRTVAATLRPTRRECHSRTLSTSSPSGCLHRSLDISLTAQSSLFPPRQGAVDGDTRRNVFSLCMGCSCGTGLAYCNPVVFTLGWTLWQRAGRCESRTCWLISWRVVRRRCGVEVPRTHPDCDCSCYSLIAKKGVAGGVKVTPGIRRAG